MPLLRNVFMSFLLRGNEMFKEVVTSEIKLK